MDDVQILTPPKSNLNGMIQFLLLSMIEIHCVFFRATTRNDFEGGVNVTFGTQGPQLAWQIAKSKCRQGSLDTWTSLYLLRWKIHVWLLQ